MPPKNGKTSKKKGVVGGGGERPVSGNTPNEPSPKKICPECGNPKTTSARVCRPCYLNKPK